LQAEAVHRWALAHGMSRPRAWLLACGASYGRKFFTFQKTLAEFTGFKIRTVQRAMRQAKDLGILVSKRIRRGERPEGGRGPLTCGGAMRTIIGWGLKDAPATVLRLRSALREQYRRAALEEALRAAVAEFRSLAPLAPPA
jgi:hypothetical protein